MTEPLKVRIVIGPTGSGKGNRVEIGGEDVSRHIGGLALESYVGKITTLRLDFVNVDVELDGAVDLTAIGNDWATYRLGRVIRDELQEGEGSK